MTEKKFAPSNIKTVETKYGDIIKIWFPVKDMKIFLEENENKGWVNLYLKSTKDWKKYLQLDTYWIDKHDSEDKDNSEDKDEFEDIPFS